MTLSVINILLNFVVIFVSPSKPTSWKFMQFALMKFERIFTLFILTSIFTFWSNSFYSFMNVQFRILQWKFQHLVKIMHNLYIAKNNIIFLEMSSLLLQSPLKNSKEFIPKVYSKIYNYTSFKACGLPINYFTDFIFPGFWSIFELFWRIHVNNQTQHAASWRFFAKNAHSCSRNDAGSNFLCQCCWDFHKVFRLLSYWNTKPILFKINRRMSLVSHSLRFLFYFSLQK